MTASSNPKQPHPQERESPSQIIEARNRAQAGTARRFAVEAARLAANTRCHQVAVLDVTGISPVCDYLVLATGTSARQMHSVAQDLMELGQSHDYPDFTHSGHDGQTWVCLDFIDIVFHLFNQDARQYYDLDNLWGDAPKIDWEKESSIVESK